MYRKWPGRRNRRRARSFDRAFAAMAKERRSSFSTESASRSLRPASVWERTPRGVSAPWPRPPSQRQRAPLSGSGDRVDDPVTLPPGRAMLVTSPSAIGSPAAAKTMGIVLVACLAARAAGASGASDPIEDQDADARHRLLRRLGGGRRGEDAAGHGRAERSTLRFMALSCSSFGAAPKSARTSRSRASRAACSRWRVRSWRRVTERAVCRPVRSRRAHGLCGDFELGTDSLGALAE